MGLSGLIGAGANEGLEDILARQMLAQQQAEQMRARKAQEAMQQQQLGLATRRQDFDEQARQEDIEQSSIGDMRAQMAAADAKITRLQGEEDQMDAAAQLAQELAALMGDPNVADIDKRGLRLKKFGGGAPHMTAEEQAAEDARKVGQVGAEAEARARAEAKFRPASGGGAPEWLVRNGQKVKGTYQPGDEPYDPVAARTAQPANTPEAVDTAREVQRIAGELSRHEGFSGAFGLGDAMNPFTLKQSTADAEVLRDTLSSLLTLENMGKMKGVLSDSDMRLLQRASTTINPKMSEGAARVELARLREIMAKVTGDVGGAAAPASGGAQQKPIPGIPGGVAESADGGKTWKRVK